MRQVCRDSRKQGFTIRDLAVVLTCVLVAAGLVASLAGANRTLSQASGCTANLETLFGGLMVYVNVYNSYPPHNPYPRWVSGSSDVAKAGTTYIDSSGIDPNIGWIMTYGLAMTPPDTYINDWDPKRRSPHFKWYVLNENDLPSVCVCPAANHDLLFTLNDEIDKTSPTETLIYQYAACYQTSGTCRSATRSLAAGIGGRNPPIPNPSSYSASQAADNAEGSKPSIWVCSKTGSPNDPWTYGTEARCYVQAVHPAEVQDPGRVYYLADSRDYRPQKGSWAVAGISDGWLSGYGNLIFMSTRHYGYANVMYLDGQVNRDDQTHPISNGADIWGLEGTANQWRCSTWTDRISMANISTQYRIMPVLMIRGWECLFNVDGVGSE